MWFLQDPNRKKALMISLSLYLYIIFSFADAFFFSLLLYCFTRIEIKPSFLGGKRQKNNFRELSRAHTNGKEEVLQVSRCFSLDTLLNLISRQLHVSVEYWNANKVWNESDVSAAIRFISCFSKAQPTVCRESV